MTNPNDIRSQLIAKAHELGFDRVGITGSDDIKVAGERLREFVDLGRHATMEWMEGRIHHRESPKGLWDACNSVIMLGMNYGPDVDPLSTLEMPDRGNISVYARNRDYHDLIKKRLKQMGRWMAQTFDCDLKVFVDTAPVMEKPLAAAAGLGWQGKHTNMVSTEFGSWLFLGAIYTDMMLDKDTPHKEQCGSCTKCLDICPTGAFPAPYQIDAGRCISYLTIEHKDSVDEELRPMLGNHIYGCDDCLSVCPWNKFAQDASEAAFHARLELEAPPLEDLIKLDDTQFRQMFSGSPIKRIGVNRFIRNVLYAIGNSGDEKFLPAIEPHITSDDPVVRDAAAWAKNRLS